VLISHIFDLTLIRFSVQFTETVFSVVFGYVKCIHSFAKESVHFLIQYILSYTWCIFFKFRI